MTNPQIPIPQNIRGLIFDLDGTIADTMPIHFLAWQRVAARYGFHYPAEEFLSNAGIPTVETSRLLAEKFGLAWDAEAVAREKEAEYERRLHLVQPIGPVVDVIQRYRQRLPMACGTGGYRRLSRLVLDRLGLSEMIGPMVAAEDVTRHKPHPETFLRAAELIGVAPAACLVFEDGDLGFKAARAAGMAVVDVTEYYQTSVGDETRWSLG